MQFGFTGIKISEAPADFTQEDLTPEEILRVQEGQLIKGEATVIFSSQDDEGKPCIYVPLREEDVVYINQQIRAGTAKGRWLKTSYPAVINAMNEAIEHEVEAAASSSSTTLDMPDDLETEEVDEEEIFAQFSYEEQQRLRRLQPDVLKILKAVLTFFGHVFTDATLKAAAWSIQIYIVLDHVDRQRRMGGEQDPTSLLTNILASIPWVIMTVLGMKMQYHLIGQRSDGAEDKPLSLMPNGHNQSAKLAAYIYTYSITEFLDGNLSGYALSPNSWTGVGAGSVLGTGLWLNFMFSNLLAFHRKYRETHPDEMPIVQQKYFNWLYRHSKKFAMFLRETLAPTLGAIHSYVAFNLLAEWHGHDHNKMTLAEKAKFALNYLVLLLLIHQAAAFYTNNFEVRQMRDNLKLAGINFLRESFLVRSKNPFIRFLGDFLHGNLLPKTIYFLGKCFRLADKTQDSSITASTWLLQTIGNAFLLHRGMNEYINSKEADKGEMFRNIFGSKKSREIYEGGMMEVMWVFAILAAATANYAKQATVRQGLLTVRQGVPSVSSRNSAVVLSRVSSASRVRASITSFAGQQSLPRLSFSSVGSGAVASPRLSRAGTQGEGMGTPLLAADYLEGQQSLSASQAAEAPKNTT